MHILLVNGPPRSGKDTLGEGILRDIPYARIFKMAEVVKEGTHASYALLEASGQPLPHDHFEAVKDDPLPEFEAGS